ncbi:MAG: cystathionine beta-synthase [Candidatus Fischerbacteria bacterium RBG_13_37_8]|uniref:Cystathionine beta-synthase n=1 Tax=Candidatus Fischerbacteria bacterium RBG_13_37_8 TaxID=1817863 RepID=A0A1F5V602_9BACT|nr:MAG: cystathionine beta-synthase [Candidatus Fischerbacteria bacterium RBG_13_37_8]
MRYAKNMLELIGKTPLVKLNKVTSTKHIILVKLESFNPGGSVKDRIGIFMLEQAEKEGKIKPGATIIEPTSGNTGVGLALACILKGYKLICVLLDKAPQEKIRLLEAYGAKCIVCPTNVPPDDEQSYYKTAERLSKEIPNSYMPQQYQNPMNPLAHYTTTGPEIWEQTEHKLTHFVCGIGTGGTIYGVAKYLKEQNSTIKIIGVDTVGSVYTDYFYTHKLPEPKPYLIDGIGEDMIPGTIDFAYIDSIIQITDKEAYEMTIRLVREEAILTGSSSGAAIAAVLKVAPSLPLESVTVVLLPDTGVKYLSKINKEWYKEHNFYYPD